MAEIRGEDYRKMLAQGGRSGPQVHDHVPEGAPGDSHELHLFMGRDLKVEPAHGSAPVVEGDAALGHGRIETALGEVAPAVGAGEETPLVREALRLQHP